MYDVDAGERRGSVHTGNDGRGGITRGISGAAAFGIAVLVMLSGGFAQSAKGLFIPDRGNFIVYSHGTQYRILHQGRFLDADTRTRIQRIASGKRIVSAADDPAGFAVAEGMTSIINSIRQQAVNEADLKNYLNFAESAIAGNMDLLQRMRVLAVRAAGGIMNTDDREILQSEVAQLRDQVDLNAAFSTFNTKRVIPGLTSVNLGLDRVDLVRDRYGSLEIIDSALGRLTKLRVVKGVRSNLMEMRIKGKMIYFINLQSAESGIRDADIAGEVSALLKNRTLLRMSHGVMLLGK